MHGPSCETMPPRKMFHFSPHTICRGCSHNSGPRSPTRSCFNGFTRDAPFLGSGHCVYVLFPPRRKQGSPFPLGESEEQKFKAVKALRFQLKKVALDPGGRRRSGIEMLTSVLTRASGRVLSPAIAAIVRVRANDSASQNKTVQLVNDRGG